MARAYKRVEQSKGNTSPTPSPPARVRQLIRDTQHEPSSKNYLHRKKGIWVTEHCFLFLSSSAVISKNLIMRFTKPRHMMEKDRSKSNLKLIFQKDAQKCVKMTKSIFGKVRKALGNMSALTSEKGLVFREVRAGQVNSDKFGRFLKNSLIF